MTFHAYPGPSTTALAHRVTNFAAISQLTSTTPGVSRFGPVGAGSSSRHLHRVIGNQGLERLGAPLPGVVQAKLVVGQADDPLEHEADRIADQVMRMPAPLPTAAGATLHRKCACEQPLLQDGLPHTLHAKQHSPQQRPGAEAPALVGEVLRSAGEPLDTPTRAFFEPRFGRDFSQVRAHADDRAARSAHSVGAHAYTVGSHIVFAHGQYAPGGDRGRRLLAHELGHVVQQGSGPARLVQRQADAGAPPGGAPPQRAPEGNSNTPQVEEAKPTAVLKEARRPQVVRRIVMSCKDMRIQVETDERVYDYRLETCSLPLGSYETTVTVTDEDFALDFGKSVGAERFDFSYYVQPGQQNPAKLLTNQQHVHVDVVANLGGAAKERKKPQTTDQCVIRLDNRTLVKPDSFSKDLFPTKSFKKTIWSHGVPLGCFGWVDLSAVASGSLSGSFAARYGPGILSDICLVRLISSEQGSAPIEDPLLGVVGRTDVTNFSIGGRARFNLPARITVRVAGMGKLRISGDYLSLIEVAAAEGAISASATATLEGTINGSVEVIARATRAQATFGDPTGASWSIADSKIDAVDLAAEIGLRGKAGLKARVDLSAGFDLAGYNLWRQSWNLVNFDAGVAWKGGFKYSPNPGPHWDLGTLSADDQPEAGPSEDEPLPAESHEDAANVEEDDIVAAILREERAAVTAPDGLSEATALPFEWRKPDELYPKVVDIPRADEPKSVGRFEGPTPVRYSDGRGRTQHDEIGVADWPAVGRTFEFHPYDSRRDPEKRRFNALLTRLGFDRSGTDGEHIWDIYLRGLEWDRFDNLWPASNQEQQLAGGQHERQIRDYRRTFSNLEGRHFVISRVRHPAL